MNLYVSYGEIIMKEIDSKSLGMVLAAANEDQLKNYYTYMSGFFGV